MSHLHWLRPHTTIVLPQTSPINNISPKIIFSPPGGRKPVVRIGIRAAREMGRKAEATPLETVFERAGLVVCGKKVYEKGGVVLYTRVAKDVFVRHCDT
jgi:hypothetical protein